MLKWFNSSSDFIPACLTIQYLHTCLLSPVALLYFIAIQPCSNRPHSKQPSFRPECSETIYLSPCIQSVFILCYHDYTHNNTSGVNPSFFISSILSRKTVFLPTILCPTISSFLYMTCLQLEQTEHTKFSFSPSPPGVF